MIKYKTVVTDYEGLQRCLDDYADSGWRLFSVQPDTWRKVVGTEPDGDPLEALGAPAGEPTSEYSASYYLIILYREDGAEHQVAAHAQSEEVTFDDYPPSSY
jgi:hypothetical protein